MKFQTTQLHRETFPRAMAIVSVAIVFLLPSIAFADEGAEFAATLEKGYLWAYAVSFGMGMLTSLTPCVYPMIPITIAVFGARDESTTKTKAFVLATSYVFGMGTLFAGLGVGFAFAGGQAGSLLSNPKVIIPLALLLFALASSLFGAFELRLPFALQNRLNQVGGKGYGGAFGMGLVGGLVAAPCTGPFLAGMLIWVATTGNPALGATMLFTYACGVGVLFWVLAVTSMSIPKSGPWMEGIKSVGGIGLVATAIHFLRPIWPAIDETTVELIRSLGSPMVGVYLGVALAAAGILMGAVHLTFHSDALTKVRKGVAVFLTVAGITLAVSGFVTPEVEFEWHTDETAAYAEAQSQDKGVVIDFGAKWCAPCKIIEQVMGDPKVNQTVMQDFVPLKFDVSELTDADQALQKRYEATTLPAVLFLDAKGNELLRYTSKSPDAKSMIETVKKAREQLHAER